MNTSSLVSVTSGSKPFTLLKSVKANPRESLIEIVTDAELTEELIDRIITDLRTQPVVALDFETRGTSAWGSVETNHIVGVGLAWEHAVIYLDVSTNVHLRQYLLEQLTLVPNLIAHNVMFDGTWIRQATGLHGQWLACTYGLYRQLATEGFNGQRWGLKHAQIDLLGWEKSNEGALGEWLISNGYSKGNGTAPEWGEMWRAPANILGYYCALDADACYQLYTRVLRPTLDKFPRLREYHGREFLSLILDLIDQVARGIDIDILALTTHFQKIANVREEVESLVRGHEIYGPLISEWETMHRRQGLGPEPPQYKKGRPCPPEPPRLRKDGQPSRTWIKWDENKRAGLYDVQVSKVWENWCARRDLILGGQVTKYNFNMASAKHRRTLLYDELNYPVILTTDSGLPATGGKALKGMGDIGQLLRKLDKAEKERSYIEAYLSAVSKSPDLRIHPGFNVPGTLTGRLAGTGGVNVQQVPKTVGTMSTWRPNPGNVWVDVDVKALEQVVLAELSGDKALHELYGKNAKTNDVYLWVGAQLPILGDAIRAAGYDPANPSPAGISAAKAQCKKQRAIAKVIVLASSYGAGPGKIHQTLSLEGIEISMEEVRSIHSMYWEIFSGVRTYGRQLEVEWRRNRGWVMNGIGRPIGVDENYTKDLVNRVIQSTGHDIFLTYRWHARNLLDFHEIPWQPVIWDWHDQLIVEVPVEHAETVRHLLESQAFDELNAELSGDIPLSGEAMIISNLAECKLDKEALGYDPAKKWAERSK